MLGYLGPAGTFSEQAAREWSRGKEPVIEYPTIAAAIKAVDKGDIDRCIVPIENNLNGSVAMTLDTLAFDADVYITAEHVINISQNLAVKKGAKVSDIKTVISHPQALGQCAQMLESEFAGVELRATRSTAQAAQAAAEGDGTLAAIAPAAAAEKYGLEIVRRACSDHANNLTRFVVIEKTPNMKVTEHDKSSIVFSTAHESGALYKALGLLGKEKINMLKIESRPMKNELGSYVFFIDIEGNADDANIYFALDNVKKSSLFYKFLGSYHYE
ncbi:MAG: prephenate dehydratase [Clostridia bacterium]|nr:prephenate dehydratase [Clostridia bacterium]